MELMILDYYSMSSAELEKLFYKELLIYIVDDWTSEEWIEHYKQEAIFYSWADANDFIMDSLSLSDDIDYPSAQGTFLWDCFCSAEKRLLEDMYKKYTSIT